MYLVYDVLTLDEARENAARWAAGREERLQWLRAQLGIDPDGASLTDLWVKVVSWYDAGSGGRTTGPCPVWWVDEYDLNDTLIMADALAHPFCDELLRREPEVRLELRNKPGFGNHRQLVMALGRWAVPPWGVPRACMERLHPATERRQRDLSTADDYLEHELRTLIRSLGPWKQELEDKERR